MKKPKLEPKGRMLPTIASFHFRDSRNYDNEIEVSFCHEEGKPGIITFFVGSDSAACDYVIDNRNGRYKPCMTHALELLRQLTKKKPANNFAANRAKKAKPELKLFA